MSPEWKPGPHAFFKTEAEYTTFANQLVWIYNHERRITLPGKIWDAMFLSLPAMLRFSREDIGEMNFISLGKTWIRGEHDYDGANS